MNGYVPNQERKIVKGQFNIIMTGLIKIKKPSPVYDIIMTYI